MSEFAAGVSIRQRIEKIFREDGPRALSTLIRLLGDFDLAEDALQDAFAAALRQWPYEGIPERPAAWLISTARFKGIDAQRRSAKHSHFDPSALESIPDQTQEFDVDSLPDDQLRLIFICCHPSLSPEAQTALTLREVCGLTTEEIARAYLTKTEALAQRIVRAKARIRDLQLPYEVPGPEELSARLDNVLRVAYLLFNEGYYASAGESATREFLSREAIRLARLLVELLPTSETFGLLALMTLHESRRSARTDAQGDLILLEDQDRTLWDRGLIAEGSQLARNAMEFGDGPYALQAGIAAVHAESPTPSDTEWNRVVDLYDRLLATSQSDVVALNRAVAVAMRDGFAAGLTIVDGLLERGRLEEYGLAHAARADFCRRLEFWDEARVSYLRALELAQQEPERRFLRKRLAEVERRSPSG